MLETSNSFDAAIVTAICLTVKLNKQKDGLERGDLNSFKGTIFTHIIKTGETNVIPISDGLRGLGNALQKTFAVGNLREDSEKETYRTVSYTHLTLPTNREV